MRTPRPVLLVAAVTFAGHAAVSGRYGFHRDELYFIAAGDHPTWGYADQPPFTPLFARAISAVAGPHLWPLRMVAGAAHSAIVVIGAVLARDLGGHRRAQIMAAIAVAICPFYLGGAALFHTTTFDLLAWAVILLFFVRAVGRDEPRYWLAIGVTAGIALENKWMPAFLLAGLASAVVVTRDLRSHLRSPWLWAGAAATILLWLPNLLWSNAHDWPGLEVAAQNDERAEGGRVVFVLEQVLGLAPALLALAVAGGRWTWRNARWRPVAIAALATELVLFVAAGKAYYAAGLYVALFAAGAIAIDEWRSRSRRLLMGAGALFGVFAIVLLVPILPARTMHDLRIDDANGESAEQLGWPELADQVAAIYHRFTPEEKETARILAGTYGEAGAIQWYGPARGIPAEAVLSGHNSYASWWPDEPLGPLIAVRVPLQSLQPHFQTCDEVGEVTNDLDIANEVRGAPIVVCRELTSRPLKLRDAFTHLD